MKYNLIITEKQARILNRACDTYSRLIEGQFSELCDLLEEAWCKRAKEATGKQQSEDFEQGWLDMREECKEDVLAIRRKYWGLPDVIGDNGVNYSDETNILYDLHQVIRHQLWLDNPNRLMCTVDSDKPREYGSEPLATIFPVEEPDKNKWKEVAKAILVAEAGIVKEFKALKKDMEKEGKSVTEIADAYLERIVNEVIGNIHETRN